MQLQALPQEATFLVLPPNANCKKIGLVEIIRLRLGWSTCFNWAIRMASSLAFSVSLRMVKLKVRVGDNFFTGSVFFRRWLLFSAWLCPLGSCDWKLSKIQRMLGSWGIWTYLNVWNDSLHLWIKFLLACLIAWRWLWRTPFRARRWWGYVLTFPVYILGLQSLLHSHLLLVLPTWQKLQLDFKWQYH